MAHYGINGIWFRGMLKELAKTHIFPEYGKNSDKLIASLNKLISRCAQYGIKVYFYFTEPLAEHKNSSFWEKHPDVKGAYHPPEETCAICTSTPKVKKYIEKAYNYLFSETPGLGGAILITASEQNVHCISHVDFRGAIGGGASMATKVDCPRCAKRRPDDLVSEIINLANKGIKSAAPDAETIAWNWSWSMYYKDPQAEIINKTSKDVVYYRRFRKRRKKSN